MRPQDTPKALAKFSVFTVVSLLLSALILGTLVDTITGKMVQYKALFTDAQMVFSGDAVRIAGVQVGEIDEIKLKGALAEVTFSVLEEQPMLESTQVAIRYENLLGRRFLALTQGPGSTRSQSPGATIPVSRTLEAVDLSAVLNGFKPIFEVMQPGIVNQLNEAVLHILQGDAGAGLSDLVGRMADFVGQLVQNGDALGDAIDMMTKIVDIASTQRNDIEQALISFRQIARGLTSEQANVGGAIDALVKLTTATAQLMRDAEPYLAPNFENVAKVSKILADNKDLFAYGIQFYAFALDAGTRIGGYGGWVNIYVCRMYYNTGLGQRVLMGPPGPQSEPCRNVDTINSEYREFQDTVDDGGGEQ